MTETLLHIEGMSCQHCVAIVTKALSALEGVAKVVVDLDAKTAAVTHDAAKVTAQRLSTEIEDLGYDVV